MINMICPEEQCTACNVCANVCPKSCVITEKKRYHISNDKR